jgi:hypothetical protein
MASLQPNMPRKLMERSLEEPPRDAQLRWPGALSDNQGATRVSRWADEP